MLRVEDGQVELLGQRIGWGRAILLLLAVLAPLGAYVWSRGAMEEHELLMQRRAENPLEFVRLQRAVAVAGEAGVWHHTTRGKKNKVNHHYYAHLSFSYVAYGRPYHAVDAFYGPPANPSPAYFSSFAPAVYLLQDLPRLTPADHRYYSRYEDLYESGLRPPPVQPHADAQLQERVEVAPFVVHFDKENPHHVVVLPDESLLPYAPCVVACLASGVVGLAASVCFHGWRGANPVRKMRSTDPPYRLSFPGSVDFSGKVAMIVTLVHCAVVCAVLGRFVVTSGLLLHPERFSDVATMRVCTAAMAAAEAVLAALGFYYYFRSLAVCDPVISVRPVSGSAPKKGGKGRLVPVFSVGNTFEVTVEQPMRMKLLVQKATLRMQSLRKKKKKQQVLWVEDFSAEGAQQEEVVPGTLLRRVFRVSIPNDSTLAGYNCRWSLCYSLDLAAYPDYELTIPLSTPAS